LVRDFERVLGLTQRFGKEANQQTAESLRLSKSRSPFRRRRKVKAVMYVEQVWDNHSPLPGKNAAGVGCDDRGRKPHRLSSRQFAGVVQSGPHHWLSVHFDLDWIPIRIRRKVS
jgi:hypothetical protein